MEHPQSMFKAEIRKDITFHLKIASFTAIEFAVYCINMLM